MAIGRLSVGVGKKGTASPHAEYIAREGKYEKDSNVEKLESTGHGNMPKWAESDPNFFWKMADEHERKNGSTYREHVITLPRELNESQRLALIHDWIEQEIGDNFAYQFAIHTPKAMDGLEQPHCHLMFSERTIDGIDRDPEQYFKRYNSKNPDRGGAKKANTGIAPADRKAELSAQRDRWEKTCNKHLELANKKARISMKSLKDRGFKREPVNLTMIQIQKPAIRAVYIDNLKAKRMYTAAVKDRKQIDIPTELEMQGRQKRLADIAKMREAAQQKQAAEKAAQAKLAQQAAEKAAQAKLAQQAAEKAAQQAIQKRTPFDLVNIRMKSIVRPNAFGRIDDSLSGDIPIGVLIRDIINAHKKGYSADLREGNNTKLDGNVTAEGIKRFMLKNINSHDVVYDYCNLSTKEFTEKHSLRCDLDDLNKLNDINPPEPVVEPVQGVREATAMNVEQKLRADSSYDNSPNF